MHRCNTVKEGKDWCRQAMQKILDGTKVWL